MDVRTQNGEISPRTPPEAQTSRGQQESEAGKSNRLCGGCTDRYGIFRAVRLDLACRIIFPICFILFNVIYWLFYTEERLYNTIDSESKWCSKIFVFHFYVFIAHISIYLFCLMFLSYTYNIICIYVRSENITLRKSLLRYLKQTCLTALNQEPRLCRLRSNPDIYLWLDKV